MKLPRFTKRTKTSLANLEPEETVPPVCDVWTVDNERNNELPTTTSTTTSINYLNLETKTTTVAWADTAGDNMMLKTFQRRRHFKGESSRIFSFPWDR